MGEPVLGLVPYLNITTEVNGKFCRFRKIKIKVIPEVVAVVPVVCIFPVIFIGLEDTIS